MWRLPTVDYVCVFTSRFGCAGKFKVIWLIAKQFREGGGGMVADEVEWRNGGMVVGWRDGGREGEMEWRNEWGPGVLYFHIFGKGVCPGRAYM